MHAGSNVPENSIFLSGNKFYYSVGTTKIKGFRGYFTFTDQLKNKGASARSIGFDFGDDTTGVKAVNVNEADSDKYYDLNGRRVEKPAKGVYIIKGNKVIIK